MSSLLMLAAGLLIAADAPKEAEKKETESLQGTWIVVNEDSLQKGEKWTIAGGRIQNGEKWTITGGRIQEGELDKLYQFYKLEPRRMPKGIEITIMAQEDGTPLAILRGIYSLKGDQLKIYLAGPGEEPPAAFPQKPGLTPVLIMKRQKP